MVNLSVATACSLCSLNSGWDPGVRGASKTGAHDVVQGSGSNTGDEGVKVREGTLAEERSLAQGGAT
jgi:hypothetical protein